MQKILVQDSEIRIKIVDDEIYISLTDLIYVLQDKFNSYLQKESTQIINKWLNTVSALQFLLAWESINNPDVNHSNDLATFLDKNKTSFPLSPQKWIDVTNGIGFIIQSDQNENIHAHVEIVLYFMTFYDSMFQIFLIKAIQSLRSQNKGKRVQKIRWDIDTITKYKTLEEIENKMTSLNKKLNEIISKNEEE